MYRIIFFILSMFLLNSSFAKEECFRDKQEIILVKRDGDFKVTLQVKGKENAEGLFFCSKDKKGILCQGDDDSGRFLLTSNKIIFKGSVVLGDPDHPHELNVDSDDEREIQSNCK